MQSLWMLAASFLFAVMAACTKAGASEFGTFELVFYRSLFGVICIAFWVWKTGRSLHTPLLGAHLLRSFLGTFAITVWFQFLFNGLASLLGNTFIATILNYLSTAEHFDTLSRGILDSKDIIYFISVITLFLSLTRYFICKRRT